MALIQPTLVTKTIHGQKLVVATWDKITEADTCAALEVAGYADKSVDINGTFGGGSIAIHGANHPTVPVYSILSDIDDTDISISTANAINCIAQHTYWIKPVRTGGSSMDLNVDLLMYRRV